MPRVSLIPVSGGPPYAITLPMTLVGRKADCDFRLDADGVAELHCVLALADGLVLLRDLDTDHIRVNNRRVRRAVLMHNDAVRIGSCEFRVNYEGKA
jgi:predicted component of type VI protein secretion system